LILELTHLSFGLCCEGEITFEDSVFEAAGAITEAVKLLIKAAADAQSERVRKGRSGDPNAIKYHRSLSLFYFDLLLTDSKQHNKQTKNPSKQSKIQ
jgi:hypothetical protein